MVRQARAEKARIQRRTRSTKLAEIIRGGGSYRRSLRKVMKQSLSQGDLRAAKKAQHELEFKGRPQTRVGHKEKKESLLIRTMLDHCPR